MSDTKAKLEQAAKKANDLVIAMSIGIMENSGAAQGQARVFQAIFSGVQAVLADAARGYWGPGTSSEPVIELADAILDMERNAAEVRR